MADNSKVLKQFVEFPYRLYGDYPHYVPPVRIECVADEGTRGNGVTVRQVLIGEVGGHAVGFAPALPDIDQAFNSAQGKLLPTGLIKILYYQRLVKSVRVLALGVVVEYRASGLAAGFYATLVRNAGKLGYGDCEMSWILEDHVLINRSLEVVGAKRYKTYRNYEWN